MALRDFEALDRSARGTTWVHRVDPRSKTLVTLVFVLLVASLPARGVAELLPLFAYPLVLMVAGRPPLRIYARPLLLALLLALCIGLANPLLDREPITVADRWQVAGGWLSLMSLVLRTLLCVTAAVTLVATTGMPRLCHGLATMGVPRVIVTQVLLLYRYLFLLASGAHSTSRARHLRSAGQSLRLATYASLMGNLLLRTLDRAERIHRAMRCRGFTGDVPVSGSMPFRMTDAMFCIGWILLLLGLRWFPASERLGGWLMGELR